MTRTIRRTASAGLFLATLLGAAATGTAAHADSGPEGGHSFNTGPQIRTGAHLQQELTVGDFPFWRITLKRGQRLTVRASVDVPGGYNPGASPHYERLGVRVYDSVRQPVRCEGSDGTEMIYAGHSTARSGGRFSTGCTVGTAEFGAIEQPGTYYIQAGIGGSTLTRGTALPLSVTVTTGTGATPRPAEKWEPGEPAGTSRDKQSALKASPTPGPSTASSTDTTELAAAEDRSRSWPLPVGAVLAGAVVALTVTQLRRGRG